MGGSEILPASRPQTRPATLQTRLSFLVLFIVVCGALIAVWWVSPYALLTSLLDAIAATVILAPGVLFGHALLGLLKIGPLPRRWVFVYSAALGLGFLSILVLLAGLLGLLNRNIWLGVLAIMTLAGILSLHRMAVVSQPQPERTGEKEPRFGWQFLWFIAAPFLTLALLAASNPPGMIWREEGNGYDVLEYHLQLPKEYVQSQAIQFEPHNVYANFPANMEMLYLLAMVFHDDVQDIGTTANMIHLAFAVLTVFAAWAIGRDISRQAGIVGGLVVATCTWLEYLSGLAYVENGMLFFGMCAISAALKGLHDRSIRWSLLAGLMAGFSAGCKYTAIPMIIGPIAITWLFSRVAWQRRMSNAAMFCLFSLLAASPWLIKNWHYTGNPIFPIANQWFTISAPQWSSEQTIQWNRAHSADVDVGIDDRLAALWQRIPGDHEQRFGPAVLVLGLLGLVARPRSRIDTALLAILLIQIGVWLFGTHLYARFATVMILPLGILACRALPHDVSPRRCLLVIVVLIAGSGWNFAFAAGRHTRESAPGAPASLFYDGKLPGSEYLGFVNQELPPDSHLLLIGDARPFYIKPAADYFVAFNRNPLLEAIQRGDSPQATMEWLRHNNYSHVLIHWSEMRRISNTYGFSPPIREDELSIALVKLTEAGLRLVRTFPHPNNSGLRYVDLYELSTSRNGLP